MIDPMLVDLGNQMFHFEWTIPGWPFAVLAFLLLPYIGFSLSTLSRLFSPSASRGEPVTRGSVRLVSPAHLPS